MENELHSLGEAVEEYMRRMRGPSQITETGDSSSQQETVKVIPFPDGRRCYPELNVVCPAGQTLSERLAQEKRKRVAALFDDAKLPAAFTEWDFGTLPDEEAKRPAYRAVLTYASKQDRGNLLLVGRTGTGKTGLAICVLRARLRQEVPSLFVSVPDLLDKIRATFSGHGDYTVLMDTVKTIDFLVLDDLGAHYATEWAREKLFQLLGYRHDWMLPTVMTSDRPLAELEQAIGRRTLARILERGQVVEVGGRDLRR